MLNLMRMRKRDLAKVTEGFREGEVTAETGVTPDRVVVHCWVALENDRGKDLDRRFWYAHERVLMWPSWAIISCSLGRWYLCVLSPMCHRFIVYLHLVYLRESLISVPPLVVYLGISVPWADIPHKHSAGCRWSRITNCEIFAFGCFQGYCMRLTLEFICR